jgi:DNA-binding transcriptional LysR family regulator
MHDFDLNLLVTLDVLLAERSVTKAAARLGLSQPAVSHALARLREDLDDPLLVREGRGMVLTPRAESLAPALRSTLQDLRRLVDRGPTFDPTTARGTFSLSAPDALATFIPPILSAMAVGPGIGLEIRHPSTSSAAFAADLTLDLLPAEAPGMVSRRLGLLHDRVAMRCDHPARGRPWDLDAYLAWPHVLVRTATGGPSQVARALAGLGRGRRVGLEVHNWLLAPYAVAGTDLLFTGAGELLAPLCASLGLVLAPPPLPLEPAPVVALWPERLHADPGHRWFRETVVRTLHQALQGGSTTEPGAPTPPASEP